MVKTWTIEDAREDFDAVLRASETEGPQIVSKSGKAAAVLLHIEQWRRMEERPKPDHEAFAKLLMAPEPRTENLAAPRVRPTNLRPPPTFED